MSEPGANPPTPSPSQPSNPSKYVDFVLYATAAVTYISLSIYNKWLLNWVLGPLWLVLWVWGLPALWKLIRRQPVRPPHRARPGHLPHESRSMSWAAHQFEVYAVEAHLPKKMRGKVSWFAIFFGDFTPDFLAKFWVYGFTINGTHYGATKPFQWHRGWFGLGFSHTMFFGVLVCAGIWAWKHNRAWTIGYLLGFSAHVLTDVNDSIGTMLLFPFTTLNWSLHTWAYAATVEGGKYLDAAAYYSSLGFVMDAFWLIVVLFSWRCLTRDYWRERIVVADPHIWSWLGKWFDERGLLAIYRGVFFYGVCRLIAWTTWAHLVANPVIKGVRYDGYPWDLSWTGPWWVGSVHLPHVSPLIVLPVTVLLLYFVYWVASVLWERMERPQSSAIASRNDRR